MPTSPVVWITERRATDFKRRDALIWIEAENHECLRRPIIKYSVRPERPTSHVSEPLSFAQIKFALF